MTITQIDKEFNDHDGENGRDGTAGIEATRKWMLARGLDPDHPDTEVPRHAVNYGHCVSFGLSGCNIDSPGDTYDIMEAEGVSGGYTDTPGVEDFRGDDPTTQANLGGSAWFDRCPKSKCGDGYTPPVADITVYYNSVNNNEGSSNPTCPNNGFVVIAAHLDSTNSDDGCRPPACDFGRGDDGWCLPPANTDPPIIYISGDDVDEDAGTASFRIALSHASSQTVAVTVITSDGTANSGSDYGAVNRRVTFRGGQTSELVSVRITNDTRDEPDETFMLSMSNPSSNAELSDIPQAESTIRDDDAPPFLGSVTNLTGVCVSGQITVSWGPPAGSNSVNDYRYGIYRDQNYVYRIAGGITTETQVTVDVTDTTLTYYAEVQARGGQNPNRASWLPTGGFTCTVSAPVASLVATSLSVGENSSVQITATLDAVPSSTASVRFNLSGATNGNGSCSAGADFYLSDTEFTFTNTTSASITLTACDDTDTANETVTLALTTTGITGLQLGSPTTVAVTITDDDTALTPVVSLTSTTLAVGEMQSIQVTASLDMVPSNTASVRFTLSGATNGNGSCSAAGADFYVSDTEFTFTNATSASVTLHACDDDDTADETVTLALTTLGITELQLGSPTRVVVTIADDDTAPAPLLK